MTLLVCKECGMEVSSAATSCPHCGVPRRKISIIKRIGVIFCGFLILIVVIAVLGHNGMFTLGFFRACTGGYARYNFKSVFDNSQYAKTMSLTAIDVINQKKISESPDGHKLICQATLMLNNSESMTYKFTFTPARDGQFYIEGQQVGG